MGGGRAPAGGGVQRRDGPGRRRSLTTVRGDRGSAIVDFALVGALLTVLFVALLQFLLALHVHSVLIDCAGEGARYGARAGRDPGDAERRAREEISASLADRYARDVRAELVRRDGLALVQVTVTAPVPVAGMFGVGRTMTVTGHALAEGDRDE